MSGYGPERKRASKVGRMAFAAGNSRAPHGQTNRLPATFGGYNTLPTNLPPTPRQPQGAGGGHGEGVRVRSQHENPAVLERGFAEAAVQGEQEDHGAEPDATAERAILGRAAVVAIKCCFVPLPNIADLYHSFSLGKK